MIAKYCIAECYKNLNEKDQAIKNENELRHLIKTDQIATEMYSKYSYLMPNFKLEFHIAVTYV